MNRDVWEITSIGEWLNRRRQDITASRVAALFDCHPFITRDQLVADLRSEPTQAPNAAMRRGRILEPAVATALAEDHPDWRLAKATTYHRLPDHRLGCTPDYWLDDDGLVQIKTVSPQVWETWQGRPPLAYTLQTLTELLVTGRTRGVLAIMVCSSTYPLHLFDVPRHDGAEQKILAAVAEWWRAWDAGEIAAPAPADQIAADVDDGSHRDLSGDNELPALLDEREGLKAAVGTAEKRLKEIDYEVKNRIGAARTAWCNGWLIKYPTLHRKEYVVKAGDYRRLEVIVKESADAE
jgi:predicted phage-related endonuclease